MIAGDQFAAVPRLPDLLGHAGSSAIKTFFGTMTGFFPSGEGVGPEAEKIIRTVAGLLFVRGFCCKIFSIIFPMGEER
jgi:hypothetical protein